MATLASIHPKAAVVRKIGKTVRVLSFDCLGQEGFYIQLLVYTLTKNLFLKNVFFMIQALSAIGGSVPVPATEFANRAYLTALDPTRNPLKEVMDCAETVEDMAPMLGIFNDIPAHKLREDEVMCWAKAGFTWVVNDGEHSLSSCRLNREQNAIFTRLGLCPVRTYDFQLGMILDICLRISSIRSCVGTLSLYPSHSLSINLSTSLSLCIFALLNYAYLSSIISFFFLQLSFQLLSSSYKIL